MISERKKRNQHAKYLTAFEILPSFYWSFNRLIELIHFGTVLLTSLLSYTPFRYFVQCRLSCNLDTATMCEVSHSKDFLQLKQVDGINFVNLCLSLMFKFYDMLNNMLDGY